MCPGRGVRVADLSPVEADSFPAVRERCRDDHPLGRVSVLKVRIGGTTCELVKAPGVGTIVASIAAVTVDNLRPAVLVADWIVVRPGAVILRAALDLSRVQRVDRHIDELQRI